MKLFVKKSSKLLVAYDISLTTQRLYNIYIYREREGERICSLDFIYIDTKYMDT